MPVSSSDTVSSAALSLERSLRSAGRLIRRRLDPVPELGRVELVSLVPLSRLAAVRAATATAQPAHPLIATLREL